MELIELDVNREQLPMFEELDLAGSLRCEELAPVAVQVVFGVVAF